MRGWPLNSKHGHYVATGLAERRLDLEVSYKNPQGDVSSVGRFALDLPKFVEAGVVPRRSVAGREVFDVKNTREPDGVSSLAVRPTARVRLEPYRAR